LLSSYLNGSVGCHDLADSTTILRAMGVPSAGDVSASTVILGLVIEQPTTAADVSRRLRRRFPLARWPPNAVHNNVPTLVRKGYLRVLREGVEPSLNVYEATREGVEHFRAWLHEPGSAPLALRDAVRAKLEFSGRADLPVVLRAIRDEQASCVREYAEAHAQYQQAERLGVGGDDASAWAARVGLALMADEAMLWGFRARRLQRLAEYVAELIEDEDRSQEGGDADV
jgi:DNA-binding PadR family transcriptional regulator